MTDVNVTLTLAAGGQALPASNEGSNMNGSKRLAVRAAAIVGACLIAAGLTAAPAYAAAGCHDVGCAGRDPVQNGCTVTSTTTSTAFVGSVPVATVWNRYAWNCNANWGRAQLTSNVLGQGYKIFIKAETYDQNLYHETMCFPGSNQNQGSLNEPCSASTSGYGGSLMIWGDMVDGTNNTIAIVAVYNSSGAEVATAWACQIGCP